MNASQGMPPRKSVPAPQPTLLQRLREIVTSPNAIRTASVAAFFVIWEYYGRRMDPIFMAPPSAIFEAALQLIQSGALKKGGLAALVVCALALVSAFVPTEWDNPILNLTLCPLLVYITVFIGVTSVPPLPLFKNGDYSYGIYLYGYPLQQVVVGSGLDVTSISSEFDLRDRIASRFKRRGIKAAAFRHLHRES